MECSICLEAVSKKTEIKLACGHKFCKKCIWDWTKKNFNGKIELLALKKGKPFHTDDDTSSMTLSVDNKFLTCPMCRAEYTITHDNYITNIYKNPLYAPLPILHRIWFKSPKTNKLSICHHINAPQDTINYLSLKDHIIMRLHGNMYKISNNGRELLSTFAREMFKNKKDFHVTKDSSIVEVVPYDKCSCKNHGTPDELLEFLINFRPT
jgi:hypothetical protein